MDSWNNYKSMKQVERRIVVVEVPNRGTNYVIHVTTEVSQRYVHNYHR